MLRLFGIINFLSCHRLRVLLGLFYVRFSNFTRPHVLYLAALVMVEAKSNVITAGLPTCTDFRGTYRFWPSITISRFHAVVYRFWKIREFLGLADFVLFSFRRYSAILTASCTYRQSGRCVAAINSPLYVMNQGT